jgi:hypothetical protein
MIIYSEWGGFQILIIGTKVLLGLSAVMIQQYKYGAM